MRDCLHLETLYTLLHTIQIRVSVNSYNGKSRTKPHKMTGPFTTYNGNPYLRYCVQWESLYALLRTMGLPACVTAYNGNPYMRYCVQWECLYPLIRTMGIPISATT